MSVNINRARYFKPYVYPRPPWFGDSGPIGELLGVPVPKNVWRCEVARDEREDCYTVRWINRGGATMEVHEMSFTELTLENVEAVIATMRLSG